MLTKKSVTEHHRNVNILFFFWHISYHKNSTTEMIDSSWCIYYLPPAQNKLQLCDYMGCGISGLRLSGTWDDLLLDFVAAHRTRASSHLIHDKDLISLEHCNIGLFRGAVCWISHQRQEPFSFLFSKVPLMKSNDSPTLHHSSKMLLLNLLWVDSWIYILEFNPT